MVSGKTKATTNSASLSLLWFISALSRLIMKHNPSAQLNESIESLDNKSAQRLHAAQSGLNEQPQYFFCDWQDYYSTYWLVLELADATIPNCRVHSLAVAQLSV
jgi:hypothetical protein